MNRREFIAVLSSVAALTAINKGLAFGEPIPSQFSLMDWAGNLQANHRLLRIDTSSEPMEYFRVGFDSAFRGLNKTIERAGGRTTFILEQYPYRYTKEGYLIIPYIETFTEKGRCWTVNPCWIAAEEEMAIAYSLSDNRLHVARFNRATHLVTVHSEITREYRKFIEHIVGKTPDIIT